MWLVKETQSHCINAGTSAAILHDMLNTETQSDQEQFIHVPVPTLVLVSSKHQRTRLMETFFGLLTIEFQKTQY